MINCVFWLNKYSLFYKIILEIDMRATLISIKAIKFVSLYFLSFVLMCYRSRNHAMAMKSVSNNSYPFLFLLLFVLVSNIFQP